MRINLLIAGTRGDIQPAIALGVGLKRAGYTVRLVTFEEFRQLATGHGLDFYPIQLDMSALLERYGRPELFDSGAMIVRFLPEVIQMFQVMFEQMTRDFWAASQEADAVIGCPATTWLGYAVAEKLGIPYIDAYVLPLAPTRSFPTIFWPWASSPGSGRGLRRAFNLLTHRLFQQAAWLGMRPVVNRCRKRVLGLPAASLFGKLGRPEKHPTITLAGFSEQIVPRPDDWGENIHVTGYWFLDTFTYEPPSDLREFLEAGPPPVYVGFGSMPSQNPEQVAALVAQALQQAGQRGILFTGRGILGRGMAQHASTHDVFFLDSAPHDWLFPRMVAVVHHGGSGTTAAGLRAGVPSILVPVATDQLLWAQRVNEMGVGPKPIPRARLTAERLAEAITQAVTAPALRERAAALGEKIRAEDGVGNAVRIVNQYLWNDSSA
jgi:UDP:flavonoid glycosyltransferase YjiC (YdhE family)